MDRKWGEEGHILRLDRYPLETRRSTDIAPNVHGTIFRSKRYHATAIDILYPRHDPFSGSTG